MISNWKIISNYCLPDFLHKVLVNYTNEVESNSDLNRIKNEVESKMSDLPNEPNLSLRVSRFSDILISTANIHVGKSKPSKRFKPCITPHVRAKIRNGNRLRQTIHQNREEWIDACREANEAIIEAKKES